MKKFFLSIKGYKTYAVAAATIVFAILGGFLGVFSWDHAMELILGGLGLSALRNGLKK